MYESFVENHNIIKGHFTSLENHQIDKNVRFKSETKIIKALLQIAVFHYYTNYFN